MTGNTSLLSHPSYLALDRAALGAPSAELASHLESCAACRAHFEAVAEPAPPFAIAAVRQRIEGERRSKLRAAFALLPVLAAAAGVSFVLMRPQPDLPAGPREDEPYIGTKGFASVWIYVKHGANSDLWDGKRPLFAGDRLRLKLDPGQSRYVAVYSIKNPNEPALLYSGSVEPGQSLTLPDAWEVDAEPGAERLLVAFSSAALEPVWSDWLRGKAPPGVTLLPFVLPKSSEPGRDGGSSTP